MVEAFVENWIRDVLQPAGLSQVFLVERAHRELVAPPQPGVPLRAIIARLLNYRDCVLREARDSDKAVFENGKISIYPDYTNKVKNSRNSFWEVKAKLHAMNIRYMLLYAVRLKLLSGGRSNSFAQPEEVWRWLEMWDKAALGKPTGARRVVNRASGADGSDWQNREGERTVDSMDQGVVDVPASRVEIQQDGTMAVVPD
ncbi:hypothetical protein NDU88_000870 [Pleurodeles waltl]|uniref:Uncharacterized protein n=1 Tax=Pleurodeles waltl TaxID=8319 RepID=A0AAV7L826_PLEWA|nr:hypothetical protein NDU88_000870 [Pleurodeles waltl]